jgi:hypothetical protein
VEAQVKETDMYYFLSSGSQDFHVAATNVRLNPVIIITLVQNFPSRNCLPKCHTFVSKETYNF